MSGNTLEARAQRRANLRRWEAEIIEDGGRRVTVLLRREDAERLRRLEECHGSAKAAIVAALRALD